MPNAEENALPPMLADRGPCLHCGSTMRDCAFGSARVCCRKCEHGRGTPPESDQPS